MLDYIPDGYTTDGFIEAEPRIHNAVRFSYRPMLAEQADAVDMAASGKSVKEYRLVLCAAIKQHVESWDIARGDYGLTLENIRRLQPRLLDKLYRIIAGRQASDPVPDAAPEDEDDYVANLLESAETGESPGAVKEKKDAKNSQPG